MKHPTLADKWITECSLFIQNFSHKMKWSSDIYHNMSTSWQHQAYWNKHQRNKFMKCAELAKRINTVDGALSGAGREHRKLLLNHYKISIQSNEKILKYIVWYLHSLCM